MSIPIQVSLTWLLLSLTCASPLQHLFVRPALTVVSNSLPSGSEAVT
jgi:hypothetical protein